MTNIAARAKVYSPALTLTTNVSSATISDCTWFRSVNGFHIFVYGKIDITIVGDGAIELDIELPVSSVFTNDFDCVGSAIGIGDKNTPLYIRANADNARASLCGYMTSSSNPSHYFSFQYAILP